MVSRPVSPKKEIEDFFWRVIDLLKKKEKYTVRRPQWTRTPPAIPLKWKQYNSFSPHFRSYSLFLPHLPSLFLSFILLYPYLPLLSLEPPRNTPILGPFCLLFYCLGLHHVKSKWSGSRFMSLYLLRDLHWITT